MAYKHESTPDKDTGWGLIFRLNDLLSSVENLCVQGHYDEWNFKLDRIWINLAYKESCIVERNDNKIISIKLNPSDYEEKEFIDSQIVNDKREMRKAEIENPESYLRNGKYKKAKNSLYKSLQLKDIWIRKLMHKNNLYIKELKSNPAGAMWGK